MRYMFNILANNCTIFICCFFYHYGVPFSSQPIIATQKKSAKLKLQFCGFAWQLLTSAYTVTSSNSAYTGSHWSSVASARASILGVMYLLIR